MTEPGILDELESKWQDFISLMQSQGWQFQPAANHLYMDSFTHGKAEYWPDGTIRINGKGSNCGAWREWLESGSTPPPF